MSQDPVRDEVNWYAYVDSRPTIATDPEGTWCVFYGLGMPTGVRYLIGGAIMVHYYNAMRKKNWKGADRYYHCLASCKAARCAGLGTAVTLGLIREFTDWARRKGWSNEDIRSNMRGIFSRPWRSCREVCKPLAPRGMPLDD